MEAIASLIKENRPKKVICMCGAGISVAAGIPDFRTPGTGLYANLEKYKLPFPEAIFTVPYLEKKPEAFFTLAKELFPGNYKPTTTHYFLKLLETKGMLLRCFTQNIDGLEREAGVDPSKIVAAHGHFDTARCLRCRRQHTKAYVKDRVFADLVPRCEKENCTGIVKPDIVFFGENMPRDYFVRSDKDFPECDLLLVMGTSLQVQPFSDLVDCVPMSCPRVLINKERVGEFCEDVITERDHVCLGECDAVVGELVKLLGWETEFDDLVLSAGFGKIALEQSGYPVDERIDREHADLGPRTDPDPDL